MNTESENNSLESSTYFNSVFERSYGDVLTEIIVTMHPKIVSSGIVREKDIFYYKLKILQALNDPTINIGSPSKNILLSFGGGIEEDEFDDFEQQAIYIREIDPTAQDVLTAEVLRSCKEVITNMNLVSFYFNFTSPKPGNLN